MCTEAQTISPIQSIVREETEDGRLIVRFLVAAMQDEIRDAKPHHRLDAARQLIKLGFEEAREFAGIPATSAQRALQPLPQSAGKGRDGDLPPKDTIDTAGLNPDLARFILAETDGGRQAVRFLVDVMLGFLPRFGPHHRMDAAKELLRRGFDDAPCLDHAGAPSDAAADDPDADSDRDPSPSNESHVEPALSPSKETLLDYEPPYVNNYGHSADDGLDTRAVSKAADALMDAVGRLKPPADLDTRYPSKVGSTIVHNGKEIYFSEHARSSVELSIATGEVLDAIKRIRESCRGPSSPRAEHADDEPAQSGPFPSLLGKGLSRSPPEPVGG